MEKIVIIPDKFKGTLTSQEVCRIIEREIKKTSPVTQVVSIPVSDGGDGFLQAFLSELPGKRVSANVNNPFFERICACYGLFENKTAVIESAEACGLKLVQGRADTKKATTYGVGELILHAVKNGAERILLGLGGTSTTDGGAGLAAALGVRFFDKKDKEFVPVGETLTAIQKIDTSGLKLGNAEVICLSDSLNPLYGPLGAAFVYAKQKGATADELPILDNALMHYAASVSKVTTKDESKTSGTGAAGGLGFSVVSFLNGKIKPGIDEVLKMMDFEQKLKDADFVITGEGKFDGQSLLGKAVSGISKKAKKHGVPVILIAGEIEGVTNEQLKQCGICAAFETKNSRRTTFEEIKLHAEEDLREAACKAISFMQNCAK